MTRTGASGWTAAAVGLLAAVGSSIGIGIPSLWGDEVATLMSASRPLPELWALLGHMDAVHGLYYLFMHWWLSVAGHSPFVLRLPSAIAIGIAAAGMWVFARSIGGRRLAWVAATVFALLPSVQGFAAEARPYAGTIALAAWLLVALSSAVERGGRWRWVRFAALAALAMAWFVYLALIVALMLAWVWFFRPALRRAVWASGAAAFVCASPMCVLAFAQRAQVSWIAGAGVNGPWQVLVEAWFGWLPLALPAWALVIAAGFLLARGREWGSSLALAMCAMIGPLLILWPASVLVPALAPRYLAMSLPAVAVVLASVLVRVWSRRRALAAVLAAVLSVAAVPAVAHSRSVTAHRGSDWALVAETIAREARPGDAIVFDETGEPWTRPRLAMRGYPDAFAQVEDVAGLRLEPDSVWDTRARPFSLTLVSAYSRVWLLERSSSTDAEHRPLRVGVGFTESGAWDFGSTRVTLFEHR